MNNPDDTCCEVEVPYVKCRECSWFADLPIRSGFVADGARGDLRRRLINHLLALHAETGTYTYVQVTTSTLKDTHRDPVTVEP